MCRDVALEELTLEAGEEEAVGRALHGLQTERNPLGARVCASGAEREGFEPSRSLTTPNGFRDRRETSDLQAFLLLCASIFASQLPRVVTGLFRQRQVHALQRSHGLPLIQPCQEVMRIHALTRWAVLFE